MSIDLGPDEMLEIAPEIRVRVCDATDEQLADGRRLTEQKRADITAIEEAITELVRETILAGQDLVAIPTSTLDILNRTRPGVANGFPIETISSDAVAEAADLVERLVDEPFNVRWPLLLSWPDAKPGEDAS